VFYEYFSICKCFKSKDKKYEVYSKILSNGKELISNGLDLADIISSSDALKNGK